MSGGRKGKAAEGQQHAQQPHGAAPPEHAQKQAIEQAVVARGAIQKKADPPHRHAQKGKSQKEQPASGQTIENGGGRRERGAVPHGVQADQH
ncbi:hypothetical protein AD930_05100 [Acetobacter malorum]|nr:hypothetical protein AD930_05100 [Acetobacter malorum]